jgi:hypothetical protein
MHAAGKLPEPDQVDRIGPLWKPATIERWVEREWWGTRRPLMPFHIPLVSDARGHLAPREGARRDDVDRRQRRRNILHPLVGATIDINRR